MALSLPPLPPNLQIVDQDGKPSITFSIYWEQFITAIESAVNGVEDALVAAGIAQDAADAANAAAASANGAADAAQSSANAANTAAGNAQSTADDVNSITSLANSYVTPTNIVTATDVGASVTLNIAAHTRVYGDGTSVSVNAGTATGAPYSTVVYIYYDQASRAGGTVTYQFTTSDTVAAQVNDRHTVGKVTTPNAGGPSNNGSGPRAPGVGVIP